MRKLDTNTLDALKARLDELPVRHRLRPFELIAQLSETLATARSRGYDLDDLVALLAEAGVTLSRNTVRNYLSRARRQVTHARGTSETPSGQLQPRPKEDGRDRSSLSAEASANPNAPSALARARERAQQHRTTNNVSDRGSAAGSFTIVPDTKDL
jgi:hypothetical protein